jgi:release factor glutamine methyltransferase
LKPSGSIRHAVGKSVRALYSRGYFRLRVRSTLHTISHARMHGFELTIPPTVFHPALYFTSGILASEILKMNLSGKRVLDVGCGSGILSLAAATGGAFVTAIDTNPAAVAATRSNLRSNGLDDRVRALLMSVDELLADPSQRFDVLVTNPPYYQADAHTIEESGFYGGAQNQFMKSVALAAPVQLTPDGIIVTILSSDVDHSTVLQPLLGAGYDKAVVLEKRVLFERLSVLEFRKRSPSNHRTL